MIVLHPRAACRGFTLIEVLVTVLILAIGLLGLAGLQSRMLEGQFEAYQRAQAMLLAEDMASRIRSNATEARNGDYGGTTVLGLQDQAGSCNYLAPVNSVANDLACWNQALRGVSVKDNALQLGSIIGARGCIDNVSGGATTQKVVRVTVAWQGIAPTVAPAQSCGSGAYGADDRLRRAVSVDVTLAYLGG